MSFVSKIYDARERHKEIGIRALVNSMRGSVQWQDLGESVLNVNGALDLYAWELWSPLSHGDVICKTFVFFLLLLLIKLILLSLARKCRHIVLNCVDKSCVFSWFFYDVCAWYFEKLIIPQSSNWISNIYRAWVFGGHPAKLLDANAITLFTWKNIIINP